MNVLTIVLKTIFAIIDLLMIYLDSKVLNEIEEDILKDEQRKNIVVSNLWKGIILLFLIIIA